MELGVRVGVYTACSFVLFVIWGLEDTLGILTSRYIIQTVDWVGTHLNPQHSKSKRPKP